MHQCSIYGGKNHSSAGAFILSMNDLWHQAWYMHQQMQRLLTSTEVWLRLSLLIPVSLNPYSQRGKLHLNWGR